MVIKMKEFEKRFIKILKFLLLYEAHTIDRKKNEYVVYSHWVRFL